ncbi:MAG TPA: DNA repair ATPase, partial [Vicinamibacteria bacterium]|nr:DNA repair ATPase [Vicinamibacteria bacterium]
SLLEKVGNADLVRGISDLLGIRRMVDEQEPTRQKYEDLVTACSRTIDGYYWLDHEEVGKLLSAVRDVHATAEAIIDEFEKVEALRAEAGKVFSAAEESVATIFRDIAPDSWTAIDQFVDCLSRLRSARGHLITLRETRYIDLAGVESLEQRIVETFDAISERAVEFLLGEEALAPYRAQVGELEASVPGLAKVTEAEAHRRALEELADRLDLLTEVVGSLEIDDATVRTRILSDISEILANLNRGRALLANRRKELLSKEGIAEFGVQFQLLSQSVVSALGLADTPEKCDEQLSKLMLQLEELETRFSEFDEFVAELTTKREEIYEAVASKKQALVDQRNRRAQTLVQAAERILESVSRRAESFETADALNAFFASDPMVAKLRQTAKTLRELGDSVHADEIEGRIKAAKEDASRGLRDRQDIYEEGQNVIKLGRHRFSVNTQPLELTMVPRDAGMSLHLTGTGFYERIEDPEFVRTRDYWSQELVSETREVYRGEFLAYTIFADAELGSGDLSVRKLHEAALHDGHLLGLVRNYASERYDEGYERGIHDADATKILEKLLSMRETADLLRYSPSARALATLFWASYPERKKRSLWESEARSLVRLRSQFQRAVAMARLHDELDQAIVEHLSGLGIATSLAEVRGAGAYLLEEIARQPQKFVLSAEADALLRRFDAYLHEAGGERDMEQDLRALRDEPARAFELVRTWMTAFLAGEDTRFTDEAVVALLYQGTVSREVSSAQAATEVEGLLGNHPRIVNGRMTLRLDELLARVGRFRQERVPGFRDFQKARHALLMRESEKLRLEEYKPRVMSAFVRNRLINEVYLPLIGDNLAKQMGALGEGKRTDLMGMLLLVSPPGYGKTTLMEYLASRLGLVFMKVNGPALGHSVTSLDPAAAPNATARQEIEKLNLAFEMGNNVLLYVDDIQHTHPEFLQKFISLCDAQRKVEGVWKGRTRTYDLRGKKFVVCMAGNPYTESGAKFQIPDMLANRADTYNLGDILEGKDELFALSYIENSLTSNRVLAPLTTRDPGDVDKLVRMARGEPIQVDQLSHAYSAVELSEILSVLEKLLRVQQTLLRINQQYILSASQQDAYRTEPPFKLQGSYRNMNKLAEKIVAAMNEGELETLIDDHYLGESQTLTTGAEENLLKLAEMRGRMTPGQRQRWEEIKKGFVRIQRMGSSADDPASRLTGQLSIVSERLEDISESIERAVEEAASRSADGLDPDISAFAAAPPPVSTVDVKLDLAPYIEKLHEVLDAIRNGQKEVRVVEREPEGPPPDYELISREAYLIQGTLIPLVKFMAHRFRGYRGIDDPKLKQLIAKLEHVDDIPELVDALQKVNVSALSNMTDVGEDPGAHS